MDYAPLHNPADLPRLRVNLYSDTQTKPTPAMKQAMMEAELGDEQMGQDPTINALCAQMAELMGKQAAVFMPSGTMCNQVAILTHCRPGDEILAHETSHILTSEGGGVGALAGAQITGLRGPRGMFDTDTLQSAFRPRNRNAPPQTLVEVEQTANAGGGAVWPLDRLDAVAAMAHAHGMATHMDGARLMNAVVASGVTAAEMVAGYDSVWLDFTKGLGAPLGAVLCGTSDFIGQAWRWKQRVGGAMRQGGICAAACIYALNHNVARLAEDHDNARRLVRGLAQIPGLIPEQPETNLVFFNTEQTGLTAAELANRARQHGIALSVSSHYRVRACTHLDIDAAQIEAALDTIREVVKAA